MRSAVVSTAAFALGALAQSSMTTTAAPVNTASATYWGGGNTDASSLPLLQDVTFTANVVNADSCRTTYDLIATFDQIGAQTATVVQGSTDYSYKFDISTSSVEFVFTETCKVEGPTATACSLSYIFTAPGIETVSTSVSATLSSIPTTSVAIGSGGSKLVSATGVACGAGSSAHGNAAAPTGLAEVYKVVVVPAAAFVAVALV